jgi:hypothetical protein
MRKQAAFNAFFRQGDGVQSSNMLQLATMMGTQGDEEIGTRKK